MEKCKDCGKDFSISDEELAFFKARGWEPPKRCKACRKLHRLHQEVIKLKQKKLEQQQQESQKLAAALTACRFGCIPLADITLTDAAQTLFIIGNGFDMMHGVPCSYYHFRDTIGKNNVLRQQLEFYITKEDLWADFEDSLAHINAKAMVGVVDDLLDINDAYNPDAQIADFYLSIEAATDPVHTILEKLPKRFRAWVESLRPTGNGKPLDALLHADSTYLNFNYTEFLETIYGIPESQILYIHGCRKNKRQELVLGHAPGSGDEKYDFDTRAPRYRSRRKREMLQAAQEAALRIISDYDDATTKKAPAIISENAAFFEKQAATRDIVVIGHSLSTVDYPYFAELIRHCGGAHWYIGCYSMEDLIRAERFIDQMGIPDSQVTLFQTS